MITSSPGLAEVVDEARAAGIVALDTEFMREKTYLPDLCLVQLATPARVVLVDPLAGVDLGPLGGLLEDPSVEVVVHAGRQDFEVMFEAVGATPVNIFDVQLAAAFAGYGSSLPYSRLVDQVTGTTLEKGEAYSDWCRRPLTGQQRRYAADDVRYLIEMAASLKKTLTDLGRLEWAREEMRAAEGPDAYRLDPFSMWKKVSGRGTLKARQLTALVELAAWREEVARRQNLPRGWVVKDQSLVEIARRRPERLEDIRSIRGITDKQVDRFGRDMLEALARGAKRSPLETEASPPRDAQARARALSGVADAVVRGRCEKARIAPELVATRSDIESVIAHVTAGTLDEEQHRLLRGWRRELAGDAVLALVRGDVAVRTTPEPPYLEEVDLAPEATT